MKQRTRIKRIKARMYPGYIQLARQRRRWAAIHAAVRKAHDGLREAYEKAREEREVSQV